MAGTRAPATTFKQAGVIIPPEQDIHLLPLLQSTAKGKAPLDRLPHVDEPRVAFSAKDRQGSSTDWICTRHVFPSAYPRSHYAAAAPPSNPTPPAETSRAKQERAEEQRTRKEDLEKWSEMASVYSAESFYPASSEEEAKRVAENLLDSKQPQVWSVVERLVPSQAVEGGITLFLAHANGMHKELYEPMAKVVIESLSAKGKDAPQISEVWSLDTFNSGDAGALNVGSLGQATSWFDHPRDMLQFLDFYLPEQGAKASTLLEEHEQGSTRKTRTLVGVGHSFSGAGLSMLNSLNPGYFEGVILVDPVGHPFHLLPQQAILKDVPMAQSAVARKEVFTSRRAATEYLQSKPFFRSWDPRVLELHARFGFRPVSGQERAADPLVTLSMSKWSEALAFSTSFLGSFATSQVKRSRFAGWAHLICTSAGNQGNIFGPNGEGPEELQNDFVRCFSTSKRATTEVLQGGHLMVQEKPDMLGARIAELIAKNQQQQPSTLRSRM